MKNLVLVLTLAFSFSSFAALNPNLDQSPQATEDTFVIVQNSETGETCFMSQKQDIKSDLPKCEGEDLKAALDLDNNQMHQTAFLGEMILGAGLACTAGMLAGVATTFYEEDILDTAVAKVFVGAYTAFVAYAGVAVPTMGLVAASAPVHLVGAVIGGSFIGCAAGARKVMRIKVEGGAFDQHNELD